MRIPMHLMSFPLCVALSACAADSVVDDPMDDDEEEEEEEETPDTTPPSVVSSSPADGETGVRADASVVIVFSEPMDAESIAHSIDTSDLGEAELSWNAAGDTLTITPVDELIYAAGVGDPAAVDAARYTVILGTGGLDRAGNSIASGYQTIFTTLKEVSTVFELDHALTGSTTVSGGQLGDDDPLWIGDDTSAVAYRGFLTFDLLALPQGAVEIAEATVTTRQLGVMGAPYASLGTALQLEHVSFAAFDLQAFDTTPLSAMGTFATSGQVVVEVDVSAAVEDDRAHRADRNSRSQYRLRFEFGNDGDATADLAVISRDLAELSVTYLHP